VTSTLRRATLFNMTEWDRFGEIDPQRYICTEMPPNLSEEGRRHWFFESGRRETELTLARVEHLLQGWDTAVEIGSGIGRLTIPHAMRFREVRAVDVSDVMLQQLDRNVSSAGLSNVTSYRPSERWDQAHSVDYAYSFIVFQHIPDWSGIVGYIVRIAASLTAGGIAQLQFDTRPAGFGYRVRNLVPDVLLPSTQRRGIRRIRRDADALRGVFADVGLRVVFELSPGSESHTFVLSRI
jgi:SAM-dependent methyltransferase